MSALPFTDRELKNAWRQLSAISTPSAGARKNPHRLMMFYAVECGLKAVWLKRQNKNLFERADIDRTGHDLKQLLKDLHVATTLTLPNNLQLQAVTLSNGQASIQRTGDISILHQAWRYGGQCQSPSDQDCEAQLQQVLLWIQGELK